MAESALGAGAAKVRAAQQAEAYNRVGLEFLTVYRELADTRLALPETSIAGAYEVDPVHEGQEMAVGDKDLPPAGKILAVAASMPRSLARNYLEFVCVGISRITGEGLRDDIEEFVPQVRKLDPRLTVKSNWQPTDLTEADLLTKERFEYIPRAMFDDLFIAKRDVGGKRVPANRLADPAGAILGALELDRAGIREFVPSDDSIMDYMPLLVTHGLHKFAMWQGSVALRSSLELMEVVAGRNSGMLAEVDLSLTLGSLAAIKAASELDKDRNVMPLARENVSKLSTHLSKTAIGLEAQKRLAQTT